MVEGGGLENRKARKGLGGSNPSSSALMDLYIIELKLLMRSLRRVVQLNVPQSNKG